MSNQAFDHRFVSDIGAVVIGRNEGNRLKRCLTSLCDDLENTIYVDSGSSDNSIAIAKSLGAEVVELDMSLPFTAARARNAGVRYLLEKFPHTELIQFVDGDCEVSEGWIEVASTFLSKNPDYAIVCGRRRERFPNKSLFNLLCDIEWDTPVGEALACGGDAMMRVSTIRQVDGYRETMIAGEEPEMCYRLRQFGWKIYRIDAEMTLHDAEMTKFSQWWKRNKRAGHAYAESYSLHGKTNEKFRSSNCKSVLFWSTILPIIILVLGVFQPILFFLLLIYPIQTFRLMLRYQSRIKHLKKSFLYATANVLGKWPQLMGMIEFKKNRLRGSDSHLIEYK